MSTFKNKTVLITGAASGIGLLMGTMALQKGAKKLLMWDIDEQALQKTSAELKDRGFDVYTNKVNVSDNELVESTAQQEILNHGNVDILINNAGIVVGKSFADHSYQDISKTMNINSLGLMYVARAFLPTMIKNKQGHIVNIASAVGLSPNPGMTVYAASKWAAVGWSESLRIELEKLKTDVKVLTVMPSYINTGMFDGVKPPLLIPLLNPDKICKKIIRAVEKNKIHLREPFVIKFSPFIRGVLPARIYDFVAGKILKVYSSMDSFKGRGAKEDG